jgi:hypothetical protein
MIHQTACHRTTNTDVWRRLRQFWCDIQMTQQHVVSAKVRCGGRNLVSLRLHPLLEPSVSPPWITPPVIAAHWSSALDNLGDQLTSVKGVRCYISGGPENFFISHGNFRMTRASTSASCSLLRHRIPNGHSFFPLWFSWCHCFPVWCRSNKVLLMDHSNLHFRFHPFPRTCCAQL